VVAYVPGTPPADGVPPIVEDIPPAPLKDTGVPTASVPPTAVCTVISDGAVTSPASAPNRGLVEVEFTSTPSGATFYERADVVTVSGPRGPSFGYSYRTICTAPCRAAVAPGAHAFALGYKGSEPHEASSQTIDAENTHVYGNYVNRSGVRTAGFVTLGVGAATSLAVFTVGAAQGQNVCQGNAPCQHVPGPDGSTFGAAIGVLLVSAVVGFALAAQPDQVKVSLQPFTTVEGDATPRAPTAGGRDIWSSHRWQGPQRGSGLALSVSF